MGYFCSPEENCTVDIAIGHVKNDYLFVGLNDHIPKAAKVWAKHIPLLFNLSYVMKHKMHHANGRKTATVNKATHTSRPGALSTEMRKVLSTHSQENKDEVLFFKLATEIMWWKYFQEFPDDPVASSSIV